MVLIQRYAPAVNLIVKRQDISYVVGFFQARSSQLLADWPQTIGLFFPDLIKGTGVIDSSIAHGRIMRLPFEMMALSKHAQLSN